MICMRDEPVKQYIPARGPYHRLPRTAVVLVLTTRNIEKPRVGIKYLLLYTEVPSRTGVHTRCMFHHAHGWTCGHV